MYTSGAAILSPAFRGLTGIINFGTNGLNGGQNVYSTVRTLCGESPVLVLLYIEQRLDDKSLLALCRTSKVSRTKCDSVLTALLRIADGDFFACPLNLTTPQQIHLPL